MNSRKQVLHWVLFAGLTMALAVNARAATITVTNTGDAGRGTLRYASTNAQDGDHIVFDLSDDAVWLKTEITITNALSINGINIRSGRPIQVTKQTGYDDRRFTINAPGKTVAFSNITFYVGCPTWGAVGGNIYHKKGTLNLNTVSITQGRAIHGGGIYSEDTLIIENCSIYANQASYAGAGVFIKSGSSNRISDSAIYDNYVPGESGNNPSANYTGGGLHIESASLTILNSTFSGNYANGMYDFGFMNDFGALGGAVYIGSGATNIILNSTFCDNKVQGSGQRIATVNGGGIYCDTNSHCYMANTIVIKSTVISGGSEEDLSKGDSGGYHAYFCWYDKQYSCAANTNATAPNQTNTYSGYLYDLADNGGPTKTRELKTNAPAYRTGAFVYYNATDGYYIQGTNSNYYKVLDYTAPAAYNPDTDKITTDQRGAIRSAPVSMGACDGKPLMSVLGTNGAEIASGEGVSPEKGTDFGSLTVGTALTNTLAITNSSIIPLTISGVTTSGTGAAQFRIVGLPASVAAGAKSNFNIIFNPSAAGTHTAAVSIVNNSTSTPYIVRLAGIGGAGAELSVLGTNGAAIAHGEAASAEKGTAFGGLTVGTARTNTFSITNSGAAALTISSWTTNGDDAAQFRIAGLPASVPAGAKSNFDIIYNPNAVGTHTAAVSIVNNSTSTPYIVYLAGSGGVARMSVLGTNGAEIASGEAASVEKGTAFGSLAWGLARTNAFSITNAGNDNLIISGVTTNGTGAAQFRIAGLPGSVAAGAKSAFNIIYNPSAGGTHTAAVSIANNSTSTPYIVCLAGTGVKQDQAALVFTPASPQAYNTTNTLSTSGGSGAGAVSYAVTDGPGEIVGANGLKATSGAGTITVVATKAADALYNSAAATGTVACARANQAITAFTPTNGSVFMVTSAVDLAATAGSGMTVLFEVASGPGSISNVLTGKAMPYHPRLSFTGTGVVKVAAAQAGNANWNAAPTVTNTFNILPEPAPAQDGWLALSVTPETGSWSLAAPAGYTGPTAGTGSLAAVSAPTGSYSITWGALAGYTAPANQSQPVSAASTTLFTGVYTALPPAPTGLAASDGRFADKVALTWNAADGANSYQVWRGESGQGAGVREQRSEVRDQRAEGENGRSQIGETSGTSFTDESATAGTLYYYWVKAADGSGVSDFSSPDTGWRRTAGFTHYMDVDLDGDGKMDLAVFNPLTGDWQAKLSGAGYARIEFALGREGCVTAPGDYDGDRRVDPAVYDEASGTWAMMLSSLGGQVETIALGGLGQAPAPGDYDGDRKTDPGVYRPADGQWTLKLSGNGYAETGVSFGGPAFLTAQRDYDGDIKHDPAIYNATNGNWYFMLSGSGYGLTYTLGFGGAGYTPAPGDYDGDRLSDPGVYQDATGDWFVMLSGNSYLIGSIQAFGGPSHTAMPGDYDGDGKTDPAVYNRFTGEWCFALTGSGYRMYTSSLGGPGEDPVGIRPDGP